MTVIISEKGKQAFQREELLRWYYNYLASGKGTEEHRPEYSEDEYVESHEQLSVYEQSEICSDIARLKRLEES